MVAWPTTANGQLTLPVLQASTMIATNHPLAQVQLTGSLSGAMYTSAQQVAEWIVRRGYLPPSYQAAAVALFLSDNLAPIATAYRFSIELRTLRAQLRTLLSQAIPLAMQIGAVIRSVQSAVATVDAAVNTVLRRLGRLVRRIYRYTIGRILATPSAHAAATPSTPARRTARQARAQATLGLRSRLTVSPASARRLRRARPFALTRSTAEQLARVLLRPTVGARVGALLIDRRSVRRRTPTITVAASALASDQVVITVVGPRYSSEAPLRVRRGVAAATLRLPAALGGYRIAIADLAAPGGPRLAVASAVVRR